MRNLIALLGLSALGIAVAIAAIVSIAGPDKCAAPSARSVESLFAPCLEQQAANEAAPRRAYK